METKGGAWMRIADMLKKIGKTEQAKVPPTPNASPRRDAVERAARIAKEKTREWVKKVISTEKVDHDAAKKLEVEEYKATSLDDAKAMLAEAQKDSTVPAPDGLITNPDIIQSKAVAEFTASLTSIAQLPQELQDPNIVLYEVKKLYKTPIDTTAPLEAQKVQKRQKAQSIEAGLKYVKKIAAQQGSAEDYSGLRSIALQKNAEYEMEKMLYREESFDLYRTHALSEELPVKKITAARGGKQQYETEQDRINDQDNKAIRESDSMLSTSQKKLDIAFEKGDIQQEKDILRDALQDLKNKTNRITDEQSKEALVKMDAHIRDRMGELESMLHPKDNASRGRYGQRELPAGANKQVIEEILSMLPVDKHKIVHEVYNVLDNNYITPNDLDILFKRLNAELSYDVKDLYTARADTMGLAGDELAKMREKYANMFDTHRQALRDIISYKLGNKDIPGGRGWFGSSKQGRNDEAYLNSEIDTRGWRGKTAQQLMEDENFRKTFRIGNSILSKGTENTRAQFRENFDLFDNEDWKTFLTKIRERLTTDGYSESEKTEFIGKFTSLREMRELVHDLSFAGRFSNLETLSKMVSTSLSGDLNTWVVYNPAIRVAIAARNEAIQIIRAQNNGHLPPNLLEDNAVLGSRLSTILHENFYRTIKLSDMPEFAELREGLKLVELREQVVALGELPENIRIDQLKAFIESHHVDVAKIGLDLNDVDAVKRAINIIEHTEMTLEQSLHVARAFNIITLYEPKLLAESKLPFVFGSMADNNIVQDIDPFRHIIVKYGMGKPVAGLLYFDVTGDAMGMERLNDMSRQGATVEQMYHVFYELTSHPKYADAMVNFRNMFKSANRISDGKSFWGQILGGKDFPVELQKAGGVGIKLLDASNRGYAVVKDRMIAEKFGTDLAGKSMEVERWWQSVEHSDKVHHEIVHEIQHLVKPAMKEFINKLPAEFINRVSLTPGYEHLYYDAIQKALEGANPGLLDAILKDEAGNFITVNGRQIETLYDLFKADPGTNPADIYNGLSKNVLPEVKWRIALMEEIATRMSGDVNLMQHNASEISWKFAQNQAGGRQLDFQSASVLDEFLGLLEETDTIRIKSEIADLNGRSLALNRRELADHFIRAIHAKAQEAGTDTLGGSDKSFYDHMAETFVEGKEHNVVTMSDIPLHLWDYRNWGSSVLSRTIGDANSLSTGIKGLNDAFGQFKGHLDERMLDQIIDEKIKGPAAQADDSIALNLASFVHSLALRMYTERKWVSDTGIIGRALTSEFTIETTESISKMLGFGGKIPKWMYGANSQLLIGPGAHRMSSSDVWVYTRDKLEKNQLVKEHHPFGWSKPMFGDSFTVSQLRKQFHGNLHNVVLQYVMTGMPIAAGLVIFQAIKENAEETRGGGGHH